MEVLELFSVLGVGFLLGIKHAIEPDHVIAVSTIASRSKRLINSSLAGLFWGVGHTITLFLIGILIILMKGEIPQAWAMSLEFGVGVMLVYFGISAISSFNKFRSESRNSRPQEKKQNLRSIFMGCIHGLAGSAALILLTMGTVETVWEGASFILIFGAGTIIGMILFTTIIGLPFIFTKNNLQVNKSFAEFTGIVSIVFGLYYMYDLGFTQGLFQIWVQ